MCLAKLLQSFGLITLFSGKFEGRINEVASRTQLVFTGLMYAG
jgi:hypothetical protein